MARKKSTIKKTKKLGCKPGQALTTKRTCKTISKAVIGKMKTAYFRNKADKAKFIKRAKKAGWISKQGAAPKNIKSKYGMPYKVSLRKTK